MRAARNIGRRPILSYVGRAFAAFSLVSITPASLEAEQSTMIDLSAIYTCAQSNLGAAYDPFLKDQHCTSVASRLCAVLTDAHKNECLTNLAAQLRIDAEMLLATLPEELAHEHSAGSEYRSKRLDLLNLSQKSSCTSGLSTPQCQFGLADALWLGTRRLSRAAEELR